MNPAAPARRVKLCPYCRGTSQLVDVVQPYGRGFGAVLVVTLCPCAAVRS